MPAPKKLVFDFQCCFCHDGIPLEETTALIVVVNWSTPQEAEQQFFCHRECFEKATHEKISIGEKPEPH